MTAGFDHLDCTAIFARFAGDQGPACLHTGGDLTFDALHRRAGALAALIATDRSPVLIWGHKQAEYLVAWWACLLAARPLIPMETDLPVQRIRDVARMAGAGLMLAAGADAPDVGLARIMVGDVVALDARFTPVPRDADDTAYIMFSSGTSGQPKGIQISYANLDGFVRWLDTDLLHGFYPRAVSGNVRYCFDVSLFELWTSWLRRIPISVLDHAEFFNSRRYIGRYAAHAVGLWVSTPSMVQVYLRDPQFTAANLPQLQTFVFCGETLTKPLVACLQGRFPAARIINTYGPTECTVAVTSVQITPNMMEAEGALPIGKPRAGCRLTLSEGEIVIGGTVVGPGYVGLPEKQAAAFPTACQYRTGDMGRMGPDGQWYFQGRGDRQVKVQGMRIDLNEVEDHLRNLAGVEAACVDVHAVRDVPRAMNAYVVGACDVAVLARAMAAELPPALVPRFWYSCSDLAVNLNTKLDRAALMAAARAGGVRHVQD
jgi:D-alanine--poly(phosphoribitol) ligase subunit 1